MENLNFWEWLKGIFCLCFFSEMVYHTIKTKFWTYPKDEWGKYDFGVYVCYYFVLGLFGAGFFTTLAKIFK